MKHLTDEEIQAYLDGDRAVDAAGIACHLQECDACRRACDAYAALYAALTDDSHVCATECPTAHGPAPAAAVCVPAAGRGAVVGAARADRVDAVVGACAMAVTAAVAVAVFVVMGGPGPAAKGLASALGQSLRGAADLLVSAGRAAAAHHGAGVVTTAGLVVCVALALDRLLLEPLLCKTEPRGRF